MNLIPKAWIDSALDMLSIKSSDSSARLLNESDSSKTLIDQLSQPFLFLILLGILALISLGTYLIFKRF